MSEQWVLWKGKSCRSVCISRGKMPQGCNSTVHLSTESFFLRNTSQKIQFKHYFDLLLATSTFTNVQLLHRCGIFPLDMQTLRQFFPSPQYPTAPTYSSQHHQTFIIQCNYQRFPKSRYYQLLHAYIYGPEILSPVSQSGRNRARAREENQCGRGWMTRTTTIPSKMFSPTNQRKR